MVTLKTNIRSCLCKTLCGQLQTKYDQTGSVTSSPFLLVLGYEVANFPDLIC